VAISPVGTVADFHGLCGRGRHGLDTGRLDLDIAGGPVRRGDCSVRCEVNEHGATRRRAGKNSAMMYLLFNGVGWTDIALTVNRIEEPKVVSSTICAVV
jgi:hypothetical protein